MKKLILLFTFLSSRSSFSAIELKNFFNFKNKNDSSLSALPNLDMHIQTHANDQKDKLDSMSIVNRNPKEPTNPSRPPYEPNNIANDDN